VEHIYTLILIIFEIISLFIWTKFIINLYISFYKSPKLKSISSILKTPKINIILPARNDEKYIGKCIEGLLKQNYDNYNIIIICDSDMDNTDHTLEIVQTYKIKHPEKIDVIISNTKPDEWVGKNWACYNGYLKSDGDILLFTDSDTLHCKDIITSALGYFLENEIDALTIRPRLVCEDRWSKIIYPMLWSFHQIKYSALLVNNPNTKIGALFGCFFMIYKKSYEKLGTHKAVKDIILEDIILGEKIKKEKFKLKMIHGEHHLYQMLSGNFQTTWQRLSRSHNMFPYNTQKGKLDTLIPTFLAFDCLLMPFMLIPLISIINNIENLSNIPLFSSSILIIIDITIITLIIIIYIMQSKLGLFQSNLYTLLSPIGAIIIAIGFIYSFIKRKEKIKWKGREYIVDSKSFALKRE
jgi:chlorobactene glucosyltransferase